MHPRNSTDPERAPEAPPPYELHSTGDVLGSSAAVTGTATATESDGVSKTDQENVDEGLIEIAFKSTAPAELKSLIDLQAQHQQAHPDASSGTFAPPPHKDVPGLNIVVQVVGSRGIAFPWLHSQAHIGTNTAYLRRRAAFPCS